MDINRDSIIRWECNNWYVRDDNLVQICTQDGGTTILNQLFTQIWVSINYETDLDKLWVNVKEYINWDEFVDIVKTFEINGLVRIIDEKNEFDTIFS